MRLTPFDWATRLLLLLLRDGDGSALLGDLTEEYARRSRAGSASEAARWCRRQLYASLAAVARRRAIDGVRAMPWGTVAIAYVVVVLLEYGAVRLFSLLWPGTAHGASVLRLVVEFPGIVVIALVAAQLRQSAAFLLGGVMLVMAAVMVFLSLEAISAAFAIATLTLGPLAAFFGGLLHRRWTAAGSVGLALFLVVGCAHAGEPTLRSTVGPVQKPALVAADFLSDDPYRSTALKGA